MLGLGALGAGLSCSWPGGGALLTLRWHSLSSWVDVLWNLQNFFVLARVLALGLGHSHAQ